MTEPNHTSAQFSSTAPKPNRADRELPGWCAIAAPLIRSIGYRLGRRYWLQVCERQDLEQELWLELLVRHGGRDRADHFRLLDGQDARHSRAAVHRHLRGEIERIGAMLVQSWPFWRRPRPAPERQMPDALRDSLAASGTTRELHHHDLLLDVRGLVAELPAADRALCQSLMAGVPVSTFDHPDVDPRIAALRGDFMALGLHEYL